MSAETQTLVTEDMVKVGHSDETITLPQIVYHTVGEVNSETVPVASN